MAAAVCVVGGLPFVMWNSPSWYWTMSATACVSAADPDRQHQMVSDTLVSLSVTRFAMYAPVVVRESAPICVQCGDHVRQKLLRDKDDAHRNGKEHRVAGDVPRMTPSLNVTAILWQTVRICCMRPRPRAILGRAQAAYIEVPRLRVG